MNKIYSNRPLVVGLMRLEQLSSEELETLIKSCLDLGIDSFDIADIYCHHESEIKLGEVLKRNPSLREKMFIQTKCGIVQKEGEFTHYDLSYDYIQKATRESLARMNLSYVDSLLLHRPDIFMDADEIDRAFCDLKKEEIVSHFGVSNMDVSQIRYLRDSATLPIEVDQLQLGLGQCTLLSQAINVNNPEEQGLNNDGIFYYLKKHEMALQCWSPYQFGFFKGSIFNVPEMRNTQIELKKLAEKYQSTPCGIATAFLSNLGKNVQVITGSTNIDHIKESLAGTKIVLSKADWYELFASTGHLVP
jgi:predicted oxidoreductase